MQLTHIPYGVGGPTQTTRAPGRRVASPELRSWLIFQIKVQRPIVNRALFEQYILSISSEVVDCYLM